ncbi:MAG TPA: complex I NDUFA9 subunit family protein [Amaricoccus sp.]|uniref:complex I NDUFA9 subunit family protein n=1 Tax=Amaricoccus sp. TaxID=1872485 RepID=UPI002C42F4E5|nr:complex I NDUFA9 subunit family protein [Amaricoccus sp.]HMQ93895.1 complex I NDUFA9 subunit family protein [Amaricoccus sp.]HMR51061.1 complex I NDUFA9 subunit family protein [Amaricoccus sp.]HMR59999.1 complex I NDUFA9 subunit family protein [Amaricoccus sp.]HMU00338.1 complex I NDUFA9 subunit family protein [Amaricoccus sp.]
MTSLKNPTPIATVFGGSGFLGRYVTQRLARAGWRVRVAVRRPNEALFVRTYGVVGQVEPVQANVRDEESTRRAIEGADAVINCVGILVETGKQLFDAVQGEGAARVARIAREEGVGRLVQISAIGADAESDSDYARSKAAGEAAVAEAFPGAVILRPSIMFGTDDDFFNRFGAMARLSPVLPLVGAKTRFQPVYVDDVAAAAVKAATEEVAPGIYELGGPEVESFHGLMQRMLRLIERRRILVSLPFRVARFQGAMLDLVQRWSFGLFTNTLLTSDQVRLLARDNVVAPDARGFEALGIVPTAMEAVLEDYLYAYRPHGQFDAITASARNLREG